jgi:hypothetical protein
MQTSVCLLRSLPLSGQFAAYYRVSTDRQGRSGLGLEAQQAAVRAYLGASTPIAEFTEVETGKRNDRPELERALALCRKRKARLVIAKLDRFSRNLAFIAALMDSGVEFVAVDNPHATRLTLHILAAAQSRCSSTSLPPFADGSVRTHLRTAYSHMDRTKHRSVAFVTVKVADQSGSANYPKYGLCMPSCAGRGEDSTRG